MTALHYVLYLSSIDPGECDKAHLHLCCSSECLALEPAVGQAALALLLQSRDPNPCISPVKLLYPKCGKRWLSPSPTYRSSCSPKYSVKYSGV